MLAECNVGCHTGRGAKEANLYTEISEGVHSYGITKHRHGILLLWLFCIWIFRKK